MPDDEPHSDECAYSIKPSLIDVEIYEETYQTAMMDNEIHNNPYLPKKHYYFLTPKELAEEAFSMLKACMEKATAILCPKLPIPANAEVGDHWIH